LFGSANLHVALSFPLAPPEKISISPVQKVLIADDMQLNQYLMGELLKNCGFLPIYAGNGKQALQLATDESFAIIFLDVYMPVMDGLQCAQLIRRLPNSNATVPIVAITANQVESDESIFKKAGISATLVKPITQEQIEYLLAEFLGIGSANLSAKLNIADQGSYKMPLLDLSYVRKNSKEDPALLVKILDSFCTTTDHLITEIGYAIQERNAVNIKNLVHQLKFSLSVVGQPEIVSQLEQFEKRRNNESATYDYRTIEKLLPLVQSLVTQARDCLSKMII
jgi:CheY-like chemotaxis protein